MDVRPSQLVCMGFIGSSIRRKTALSLVTLGILVLVPWAKGLSQPWQWIIGPSIGVALLGSVFSVAKLARRDGNREGDLRLRAFVSNLERPGISDSPAHLKQASYDAIIENEVEK